MATSTVDAQELTDAVSQLRRALRRSVRPGVTRAVGQIELLQVVAESGPVRIGSLAETLRLAPSTASELLARLTEDKLVVRKVDAGDKRATAINLTAAGRRELQKWQRANEKRVAAALASLSQTQQRALRSAVPALQALAAALAAE